MADSTTSCSSIDDSTVNHDERLNVHRSNNKKRKGPVTRSVTKSLKLTNNIMGPSNTNKTIDELMKSDESDANSTNDEFILRTFDGHKIKFTRGNKIQPEDNIEELDIYESSSSESDGSDSNEYTENQKQYYEPLESTHTMTTRSKQKYTKSKHKNNGPRYNLRKKKPVKYTDTNTDTDDEYDPDKEEAIKTIAGLFGLPLNNFFSPSQYKLDANQKKVLARIEKDIIKESPTVEKILESNTSYRDKKKILKKFEIISSMPKLSYERYILMENLIEEIASVSGLSKEEIKLIDNYQQHGNVNKNLSNSWEARTIKLDASDNVKGVIMSEIKNYRNMSKGSCEKSKLRKYIETALNVHREKTKPVSMSTAEYSAKIRDTLEKSIYGLEKPKEYIYNFAMTTYNKTTKNNIILMVGPPGVGKTMLAQSLGDCLDRDVIKISLGSASDSTVLKGHSRTYVGSCPGAIVNGLLTSRCNSPIIYLDEIDKVSSRHSNEVSNCLVSILDSTQNHEFLDDYLGFPIDISKCLFVLSANHINNIDNIIKDRMHIIEVPKYTTEDKIKISKKYLIPTACVELGIGEIVMTDDALESLIKQSDEEGVRKLKRNIEYVIKRVGIMRMTNGNPAYGEKLPGFVCGELPTVISSETVKNVNISADNLSKTTYNMMYN